jgi:ribonuclease VapC
VNSLWLLKIGAELVSVDAEQIDAPRLATYGKRRHTAGLNFGDCFSNALALARGEPLLFKGEDVARTDVTRPPATKGSPREWRSGCTRRGQTSRPRRGGR